MTSRFHYCCLAGFAHLILFVLWNCAKKKACLAFVRKQLFIPKRKKANFSEEIYMHISMGRVLLLVIQHFLYVELCRLGQLSYYVFTSILFRDFVLIVTRLESAFSHSYDGRKWNQLFCDRRI